MVCQELGCELSKLGMKNVRNIVTSSPHPLHAQPKATQVVRLC